MKRKKVTKYLIEGLLIVFSVLFALWINKVFEDYKTAEQKEIALQSIHREIENNARILASWEEHHISIRDRISSMVFEENDSLISLFKGKKYFELRLLTNNESLIDNVLSDTAWESAKTTGIIVEFDFETTEQLTKLYTMQKTLMDKTMMKILDLYFEADTHDLNNLEAVLIQFQLRFWELTGQEALLTHLYDEQLKAWK